jgi:hypothetical protein
MYAVTFALSSLFSLLFSKSLLLHYLHFFAVLALLWICIPVHMKVSLRRALILTEKTVEKIKFFRFKSKKFPSGIIPIYSFQLGTMITQGRKHFCIIQNHIFQELINKTSSKFFWINCKSIILYNSIRNSTINNSRFDQNNKNRMMV